MSKQWNGLHRDGGTLCDICGRWDTDERHDATGKLCGHGVCDSCRDWIQGRFTCPFNGDDCQDSHEFVSYGSAVS